MGLQYPPYAFSYQFISGTTTAVVSTTPVIVAGLIVNGVDSSTVSITDGTNTIRGETAVGHFDMFNVKLPALSVVHAANGISTVVYFSLPSGV